MSVEATKETLCINQIIGKKVDTAIIEEDFVVPDIKPDILNAINTSGVVCIYKKEVMDGKIRMDGCVNTYIMYLADDGESAVRSLNVNLDFSHIVDFSNLKIGMMVETNVAIKTIECRVINGRKINVRAILEIELNAYSNEDLEFVQQIGDIKDVQLLKENLSINSLLGTGNTKVYAKDTIMIDSVDDLAEIMKVNLDIRNREIKVSYNKILVKADCIVKIMYLTGDNRICTKTASIPVMGFVDMPNVTDDNICEVNFEIKNILIKPNSIEEHSIYVEAEIEVMCNVFQTRNIDVIQDLYSPTTNLVYEQKMIRGVVKKEEIQDLCQIRQKEIVEQIGNNQIYDVDVCPSIINQTVLNDKIVYEGELELKFIFASANNSAVNEQSIKLPFDYSVNFNGINPNTNVNTRVDIAMQDFVVMPDESVDIKVDLNFRVEASSSQTINVIQEINIEENRESERYSIIIYFVKKDDTLWKIAKRFRSTVDSIVALNGIEDENKIQIGEQLFIPMPA